MDDNFQSNPQPPKPASFPSPPPPPSPRPTPTANMPPPPPEINLRTMKTDLGSLEKGGSVPPARPFPPPPVIAALPSNPAPAAPPAKITPPTVDLSKKEKFGPQQPQIEEEASPKKLMWLGVLVIVIGVGFLGYFVLFPMLFSRTPGVPNYEDTPAPTTETSAPTEETPTQTGRTHTSLLEFFDGVDENTLETLDLANLQNTLLQESRKGLPGGTLLELVLNDNSGFIGISKTLPLLLTNLSGEMLLESFEDDASIALYYDNDGSWPVWILKVKSGKDLNSVKTKIQPLLESSANLANLYPLPPGSPNGTFKNGQVSGVDTRYLPFSKKGASLNIAWKDNKLIISTSFNALKKVLSNI